jgi:NAD-dependent dihydropyrimidine dehydrogenase PreA subunit
MPVQVNQEECTGCSDCVTTCPVEGVLVLESEKVVVVAPDECIECNACIDECSSGAMKMSG